MDYNVDLVAAAMILWIQDLSCGCNLYLMITTLVLWIHNLSCDYKLGLTIPSLTLQIVVPNLIKFMVVSLLVSC